MIANAFSRHYVAQIKLKATPKEIQLFAKNKVEREKLVLADNYNQINITTQEASDRSKRVAGRHIRG